MNAEKNLIKSKNILLASILLTALFGSSMDIFVPALPNISFTYKITENTSQILLTAFLIPYALFQIIYAPLSDYLGRRTILLISLALFSICSFTAGFLSLPFKILLLLRIFTAFGTCAAIVSAFSIIKDVFDGKEFTTAISYTTAAMSFFPAAFVIIGGFLNQYYGWQIIFIFGAVISLCILLYCYFCLEETKSYSEKISLKTTLKSYSSIIRHVEFWIYFITSTTIFVTLLTFLYHIPFIFLHSFKANSSTIGILIGVESFFLVLGSWMVSKLSNKFTNDTIIYIGSFFMILSGLPLMIWLGLYSINIWLFFILVYVMCIALGMINPAAQDQILKPFKNTPAQANALSGCVF